MNEIQLELKFRKNEMKKFKSENFFLSLLKLMKKERKLKIKGGKR